MATKPVADTKPIVWEHCHRSYAERRMGGASHRPAVGFVFLINKFMKEILKSRSSYIAIIAAIFLAGFFGRPYFSAKLTKAVSFFPSSPQENQIEYSCTSIADASLFREFTKDRVITSSGKGTDKLSLEVNLSEKYLKLLTVAGVEAGATEGVKYQLIENNDKDLVGIARLGVIGSDYSTIVFNKKSGQAIWTKASDDLLGLSGSVFYLNCN